MDESILIQRASRQDEQAWQALIQSHQEAVFHLAYLFTGDADDAEDIAQETFIRAYRSIERVDPARSFRPWILSIAANLSRNRLRGLRRYFIALQRFARREPEFIAATAPDLSAAGEAQALWKSVQRLSLQDQQVIYLRYFLELSEEEMADALGIAQGTVKSRLHRALDRLRGQWKQDTQTDGEEIHHA